MLLEISRNISKVRVVEIIWRFGIRITVYHLSPTINFPLLITIFPSLAISSKNYRLKKPISAPLIHFCWLPLLVLYVLMPDCSLVYDFTLFWFFFHSHRLHWMPSQRLHNFNFRFLCSLQILVFRLLRLLVNFNFLYEQLTWIFNRFIASKSH